MAIVIKWWSIQFPATHVYMCIYKSLHREGANYCLYHLLCHALSLKMSALCSLPVTLTPPHSIIMFTACNTYSATLYHRSWVHYVHRLLGRHIFTVHQPLSPPEAGPWVEAAFCNKWECEECEESYYKPCHDILSWSCGGQNIQICIYLMIPFNDDYEPTSPTLFSIADHVEQ